MSEPNPKDADPDGEFERLTCILPTVYKRAGQKIAGAKGEKFTGYIVRLLREDVERGGADPLTFVLTALGHRLPSFEEAIAGIREVAGREEK